MSGEVTVESKGWASPAGTKNWAVFIVASRSRLWSLVRMELATKYCSRASACWYIRVTGSYEAAGYCSLQSLTPPPPPPPSKFYSQTKRLGNEFNSDISRLPRGLSPPPSWGTCRLSGLSYHHNTCPANYFRASINCIHLSWAVVFSGNRTEPQSDLTRGNQNGQLWRMFVQGLRKPLHTPSYGLATHLFRKPSRFVGSGYGISYHLIQLKKWQNVIMLYVVHSIKFVSRPNVGNSTIADRGWK